MIEFEFEFEEALIFLKNGKKVFREGWNGKNQFVCMQSPDEYSKMKEKYLYLKNCAGNFIPWVPSQGDLFAADWREFND